MKLLYIVGNRPQFIKLAVLHHETRKHTGVHEAAIHTGQHFSDNMSSVFFDELQINMPVTNLYISSLPHAAMIGQMMVELEKDIGSQNPDFVVVFGDTNSTVAGALAAKKLSIPVVHIEAGIRTGDENMPEESNRYITDRVADINFCCTELNAENLSREGYGGFIPSKVVTAGDLMFDAYVKFAHLFQKRDIAFETGAELPAQFALFTLHRKQNVENPHVLQEIIGAVNAINKDIPVLFIIHPNTKNLLTNYNLTLEALTLPPQGYLNTQYLLQHCSYVITDSGGVQREAFFHRKPTLIIMENPFWPEVIQHGNAVNSPSNFKAIIAAFQTLKNNTKKFSNGVFGVGSAAEVIIRFLLKSYHEEKN